MTIHPQNASESEQDLNSLKNLNKTLSGRRLPCDLPAHLLRRHRCHLLPRAQGRLDQLQVLIRTKNSASLILWMLQLHVLIRTAKSTFITFLWMHATATNSHSHKQTSLSITHS